MKKLIMFSSFMLGAFLLAGCGQQQASQTQPTNDKSVATQQPASESKQKSKFANWKTYHSKTFGISVDVPNDWKEVLPFDGSLTEINENSFEGGHTIISSPDNKETMAFTTKTDLPYVDCQQSDSNIGDIRIKEIICNNSTNGAQPGRYNYEFIEKDLVIVFDEKTDTIDKILSSIK